jgi:hypothetical protein
MGGHGPHMMQMMGPPPHGMMPGGEIIAPTPTSCIVDVNNVCVSVSKKIFLVGIELKICKFSPKCICCCSQIFTEQEQFMPGQSHSFEIYFSPRFDVMYS